MTQLLHRVQFVPRSQPMQTIPMSRTVLLCSALAALWLVAGGPVHPTTDTCPPGTRPCLQKGQARCLHQDIWCNGVWDCEGGLDEKDCRKCGALGFRCDGKCVRRLWTCDGHRDCKDGADESGCVSLPADQLLTCWDKSTRRRAVACDGWGDCPNREDEAGCTQENCKGRWCDGRCLRTTSKCDGLCKDGQDADCPVNSTSTTTSASNTIVTPRTTTTATTATSSGERLAGYVFSTISLLAGVILASLVGVLWRQAVSSRRSSSEETVYPVAAYQAAYSSQASKTPGYTKNSEAY